MEVGDEREGAAAAELAAVEHDRAGLAIASCAAGEHAADLVEPARGDRRLVDEQLEAGDVARRPGRDREPLRAVLVRRGDDRVLDPAGADAADGRPGTRRRGSQNRATTAGSPAGSPLPAPR